MRRGCTMNRVPLWLLGARYVAAPTRGAPNHNRAARDKRMCSFEGLPAWTKECLTVRQYEPKSSVAHRPGSQRARCSCVPNSLIIHATMLWMLM
jgi:hypothetical protein